jgi:ArsR family transcriptional regulator
MGILPYNYLGTPFAVASSRPALRAAEGWKQAKTDTSQLRNAGAQVKELEQYFKGLADQNRLRILNLLLHGELCVCDIHYVLETSQPNTSRHLTYLKNAGLIIDRREGARMYYRLAQPEEVVHKLLFGFLREAFQRSEVLGRDLRTLKKAIETGSCTVSEWKPAMGAAHGASTQKL